MHPEIERERRALADVELVASALWSSGNPCEDSVSWVDWLAYVEKSGNPRTLVETVEVVRSQARAVLAALRQTTAEPDTAGREAGAAEMRERAAREAERLSAHALYAVGAQNWRTASEKISAAIRSLPLHPEGSERTMGGEP